jgi:hypothetical protein
MASRSSGTATSTDRTTIPTSPRKTSSPPDGAGVRPTP